MTGHSPTSRRSRTARLALGMTDAYRTTLTGATGRGALLCRRLALLAALMLALGACAPGAFGPAAATDPAVTELERTAQVLFHRMELGFLDSGVYTTNALIDVKLPEGARWTLQEFASDGSSYVLTLTSSRVAGVAWRISPRGVARFKPA